MTFEEEKLQESLQTLRDMEKRCVQDIGWLRSVRNKVFGGYDDSVSTNSFSTYWQCARNGGNTLTGKI